MLTSPGSVFFNTGRFIHRFIWLWLFIFLPVICFSQGRHKDSLTNIGISLYEQGEYKKAVDIFTDRLTPARKQKDAEWESLLLTNLGNAYSQMGKSVISIKYYQSALSIAERLGDRRRIARIQKNIGALYAEQKDFEMALKHYAVAEQVAGSINDTLVLADCYNNRGIIYEQQLKFKDALMVYSRALEIYERSRSEDRVALTLNNLGVVYKQLKNYPESIRYYSRALKLSEKLSDQFMVSANLNNLANVYALMGNFKEAISLHRKSLDMARKIDALNVVVEAYGGLADDYAGLNDFRSAFQWHKGYSLVYDSLINTERSQQIGELEAKYETEKKEREIVALKQQRQINNLKLKSQQLRILKHNYEMLAIAGLLLILGIAGLSFYNRQKLRQRQQQEKAVLDAEFKERMRIARDVHDDLGSGLSRISLMAGLAERKVTGDHQQDIRHIAGISKELVESMRDLIWVLNPENTTMDNLLSRIREYCLEYFEESGIKGEIVFPEKRPVLRITREAQRNLFLTVKEAVHNAVKHAHPNNILLRISYKEQDLQITISDDGNGFEYDQSSRPGNGLKNMRHRIDSIGGSFVLKSLPGSGTTISIRVPLSQLVKENIIL